MKRLVTLTALVLTLLVLGGGTAFAHVQSAVVDGGDCASDCLSADITDMYGFITCTAGEEFLIRVNVRQNGETAAAGRANGICTGSSQGWQTGTVRNFFALQCGPFSQSGVARTTDGAGLKMQAEVFDICN